MVKLFKNGQSKICGRQPLKKFTWSILEYLDPNIHVSLGIVPVSKCVGILAEACSF